MQTVWRFPLKFQDSQTISMPAGAKLLHVKFRNGQVEIWALVDTTAPYVKRLIAIRGTGQPFEYDKKPGTLLYPKHVGTVFTENDELVFHVFDLGTEEGLGRN